MRRQHVVGVRHVGWLDVAPYVLVLLIAGTAGVFSPTDPVVTGLPNAVLAGGRPIILGIAYLLALAAFARSVGGSIRLLVAATPLLALIGLQAASGFWANAPALVAMNVAHQIGLVLASVSLGIFASVNPIEVVKVVQRTLFVLVSCSVAAVMLGLEGTIHETGRWSGLAGNPNTLGMLCLFLVLFTLVEWGQMNRKLGGKAGAWVGLTAAVVGLAWVGARSVTSGALIAGTLFLYPALRVLSRKTSFQRAVYLVIYVVMAVVAYLLLELLLPKIATYQGAVEMLGRDATLTGRSALWEWAMDLIRQRPLLGWSFDSWQSLGLSQQLTLETFRQFHNGYLDLAVRGGLISLAILLWLLMSVALRIWVHLRNPSYEGAFAGCALAILVMSSLTEATIFRELQVIWVLFVGVYFTLLSSNHQIQPRRAVIPKHPLVVDSQRISGAVNANIRMPGRR